MRCSADVTNMLLPLPCRHELPQLRHAVVLGPDAREGGLCALHRILHLALTGRWKCECGVQKSAGLLAWTATVVEHHQQVDAACLGAGWLDWHDLRWMGEGGRLAGELLRRQAWLRPGEPANIQFTSGERGCWPVYGVICIGGCV